MWYRYKIFNLLDQEAKGLPSQTHDIFLTGIGRRSIEYFKGFGPVIVYEGSFLPINFEGLNPYRQDGKGVYVDENYDVHLELFIEED